MVVFLNYWMNIDMDFTITDSFMLIFLFTLISYGKAQAECGVYADGHVTNERKTICLELYHDTTRTWGRAKTFCENKGGRLLWDDSDEKHLLVHNLVQHFSDADTAFWWMGGKERRTEEWMLVNGQTDQDASGSIEVDHGNCTAYWYDGQEEGPERHHLACTEHHLFICETSSARNAYDVEIGDLFWEGKPFYGNRYYMSFYESSWYSARTMCREYGMDLLTYKDIIPQLYDEFTGGFDYGSGSGSSSGKMLWYGSSQSRWFWIGGENTETEMEGNLLWDEFSLYEESHQAEREDNLLWYEPSFQTTDQRCARVAALELIQQFGSYDRYAWQIRSCQERAGFICEIDTKVTPGGPSRYVVGVLVIAVLFFLISCGLCAYIIFTHYKRRSKKSDQPSPDMMVDGHARVSHNVSNIYEEAGDVNTEDVRAYAEVRETTAPRLHAAGMMKNEAVNSEKNVKQNKNVGQTEADSDSSVIYDNNIMENGGADNGGAWTGKNTESLNDDTVIIENTLYDRGP